MLGFQMANGLEHVVRYDVELVVDARYPFQGVPISADAEPSRLPVFPVTTRPSGSTIARRGRRSSPPSAALRCAQGEIGRNACAVHDHLELLENFLAGAVALVLNGGLK